MIEKVISHNDEILEVYMPLPENVKLFEVTIDGVFVTAFNALHYPVPEAETLQEEGD